MARRALALRPEGLAGGGAVALVLALTLGTLAAVALRAEVWGRLGPQDWAAIRFTLTQAFLSAALSVVLAVPAARALARRRFPGRGLFIALLGAPFILPVIVAILGLLAIYGRAGLLSHWLGALGQPPLSIYGLHGVVLAHVFFNLPLATRLVLQGWLGLPAERFRLAAQLGFGPGATFRHLEWPMLRAVLPGAFVAVFLICLTSFAVALTLGGGPRATTVELAIYQAFRLEFDLGKAALLGLVQIGLCAAGAAVALLIAVPLSTGTGLDRAPDRPDAPIGTARFVDGLVLVAVAAFLLPPLLSVAIRGLPALPGLPPIVWEAAARSLAVALASAAITLALGVALSLAIAGAQARGQRHRARLIEAVGYLPIAASPLVIGTGLFILVFPIADPVRLALPMVALVNALMSLPFALRVLVPAACEVASGYGRLADSLGIAGFARLRLVTLPRMRRALGFSGGLAAALSAGDLGVVALFADPEAATLPLVMYRLMAAYRMGDAAGAGLVLLALSFALFWVFDRGGRARAAT